MITCKIGETSQLLDNRLFDSANISVDQTRDQDVVFLSLHRRELYLFLGLVICFTFMRFTSIEAILEDVLVTHLPGFKDAFPSKHYSGYIEIDNERYLFYYFVVSEREPKNDPIVLWLNGGPGCSSFDGFVYEHGPFNFETGKPHGSLPTLRLNPYSWSKVSNIIYLDSPVGVGFSYSKGKTKYVTGDRKTAIDTHTFLVKWFKLYPEFVNNSFYIAGESYAGVYIPTLAVEIIQGIKDGIETKINFKGYMVGNGVIDVTDIAFHTDVKIQFMNGMGLISDDLFEDIQVACKMDNDKDQCNYYLSKAAKIIDGMNKYNILEPCYHPPKENGNSTSMPLLVRNRTIDLNNFAGLWTNSKGIDDCFNDEVATTWLNNALVRKAIHAEPVDMIGHWVIVSENILNSYEKDLGSMIPYHRELTTAGYRALIYSGDHDMIVPFTGTQRWIKSLGYEIVDEWRPWLVNDQVAGIIQGYNHELTFLTIKGAGHRVPNSKPQEALHFYSRWLDGEPI
ncbi:serine carboxypeptidase-like 20 [Tripterygium wilfordii]|uniref:serine carboxypeptidase-like 20 n=1 Tax=Tripterygium wilfordii TaxID=458696 RepID=UPI0018F8416D|nr:serine carboxypeptidase-like 20 [Tripterygium wilfordii]